MWNPPHACRHTCCLSGVGGACAWLQRASCKKKSDSFCGGSSGAEGCEKESKFLFRARKRAWGPAVCEQSLKPLGHVACPMHRVSNFQGKHDRSKELWLPWTDSNQLYAICICPVCMAQTCCTVAGQQHHADHPSKLLGISKSRCSHPNVSKLL